MQQSPSDERSETFEDLGVHIRRHLGVIRSRFWTILACVVVVFTLVAIRTFKATPVYEASARLLIERRPPQFTAFDELYERRDEKYFATQVKLVTSKGALEEALKNERVKKLFKDKSHLDTSRPGFLAAARREMRAVLGGKSASPVEPWERLRRVVQVKPVADTTLVDIRVQRANGTQAALVANAVAQAYIDYSVQIRQESAVDAFQMLQQQRKEQEEALTKAEDALLAYREKTTIPLLGSPDENNAVMQRLRTLNDAYTSVQLQRLELSAAAKAISRAQQEDADLGSLLSVGRVRSDPALSNLLKLLDEESATIQAQRLELEAALAAITSAQSKGDEWSALLALDAIGGEPAVRDLRDRIMEAQIQTQLSLLTYGEKHPQVQALKSREKQLESQLREVVSGAVKAVDARYQVLRRQEEEQRKQTLARIREVVSAAARAVQADHQMLLQREEDITQALAEQNRLALEQGKTSHVCERLNRDVERQARVFEAIVDRIKEVDLTKDTGLTNVTLVELASAPRAPIKPNKQRSLTLGMLLGLMLGIGTAYGLEHLSDTVKTPEDVERRLGMAWLGYVPVIAAGGDGRDSFPERATHALMSPSSATTESFRSIRTNIYFSAARGKVKSLVITSAMPQEGKTVFAANLAATVAMDGKRVLLVDADLRRPMVHTAFNLDRKPGLTNMLAEGTPLEQLVQIPPESGNGTLENLHILCAGDRVPAPAELLGGQAMARFVRQARKKYDMVIFDSCPAMFVADAAPLTSGCDGVLLVMKAAHTRCDAIDHARKQLEAVKGNIIGGVLNAVRPKTLRDYSYYYGYRYYDYQRYYSDYADEDES